MMIPQPRVLPLGETSVIALALLGSLAASAQSTTFAYQGELAFQGTPVSDVCDIDASVWDDLSAGSNLASQVVSNVPVASGRFSVDLDFGPAVWTGAARYLEVAVRCPAGSGAYTPLSPRQTIRPAPYSLRAASLTLPAALSGAASGPALTVENTGTGLGLAVNSGMSVSGAATFENDVIMQRLEVDDLVSDGTVDFSSASSMQAGALTASDVETSSLTTTDHQTTNFTCTGCVDETDVSFPVYANRSQHLYEATNAISLGGGGLINVVTATCASADDLPLQGYCPHSATSAHPTLLGTDASNWSSGATNATFSCIYANNGGVAVVASARIICIGVP